MTAAKGTFQEQLARQVGFINSEPVMVDVLIQGKVETLSLNGCANIDEYNHYADFMNAVIQAAGGSMSTQESNACTLAYNRLFGRSVHLLPETEQNPADSGDKVHEGNNTTHQPKLEDIHMPTHSTETTTNKHVNDGRIAQLEAELSAVKAPTPPTMEQYLGSIENNMHSLATTLAAKKTYTEHAVEVSKVAGGVALGIGLAFGIKAGVEYLFFKPVG